jgi:1-acyl-sn-glycerol-3-phosphate acyltransferase
MEEDWLSYLWYEGNSCLSLVGMTLAFSMRTEGYKHVPRTGPALLISNHQSFLDPVLIGLAARRHLCYLARHSLFRNPLFRWLISSLGAVPINQEGFAREGLKTILEQLQKRRAVVVFPEGERTSDGNMVPLRPGIHLLIRRGDMPIVPIGIAGAFDAWPRWRAYPIPAPLLGAPGKGTLAVSIGRPLHARQFANQPREQVLSQLFTELQKCKERAERLRRKT